MRTYILALLSVCLVSPQLASAADINTKANSSPPAVNSDGSIRVAEEGAGLVSAPLDSSTAQLAALQDGNTLTKTEAKQWTREMNRVGIDLGRAAMSVREAYDIVRDRMHFHKLEGVRTLTPDEFNRWQTKIQRHELDLGQAAFATGIALQLWAARGGRVEPIGDLPGRRAVTNLSDEDPAERGGRRLLGQIDDLPGLRAATNPNSLDSGQASGDAYDIPPVDLSRARARALGGRGTDPDKAAGPDGDGPTFANIDPSIEAAEYGAGILGTPPELASTQSSRQKTRAEEVDLAVLKAELEVLQLQLVKDHIRRRERFANLMAGLFSMGLFGTVIWYRFRKHPDKFRSVVSMLQRLVPRASTKGQ